MDKNQLVSELEKVRSRLDDDVVNAYEERGSSFGQERFDAWRQRFESFLRKNLPGKVAALKQRLKHYASSTIDGETDADTFMREDGDTMLSFIDSLILDIKSDEIDLALSKVNAMKSGSVEQFVGKKHRKLGMS